MARTLRYHPDFYADVLKSASWYDERNPALGDDFVAKVGQAIESLIADPERRNAGHYGIRYWPVERFPYVVFYDLTDRETLVAGVMHTSQDPSKWRTRLG